MSADAGRELRHLELAPTQPLDLSELFGLRDDMAAVDGSEVAA
ncbi:hypothetical protein ACPEEZ_02705 [Frigoribacterium sp. 2-23]